MEIQRRNTVLRGWAKKYNCHVDVLKSFRSVHLCIGCGKAQGHPPNLYPHGINRLLKAPSSLRSTIDSSECLLYIGYSSSLGTTQSRSTHHRTSEASYSSSLDTTHSRSAHRCTLTPGKEASSLYRSNRRLPNCCSRAGYWSGSCESDSSKYRVGQERCSSDGQAQGRKTSKYQSLFVVAVHFNQLECLGIH